MTNLQQRLASRLHLVRKDLDEVLGRISDSDLSWAPVEGMRTVGGQLQEIVATEMQIMIALREGRTTSYVEMHKLCERGNLAEYVDLLERTRAETLGYLESLTDEELEAEVRMPLEYSESLGMEAVPRSEVLRSIAQHEWYHVGQLVSYVWSRGDDPYSW